MDPPPLSWHRPDRRALWDVSCALCGTRLTVGSDLDASVALAARNIAARPCCDHGVKREPAWNPRSPPDMSRPS